MCMDCLCKPFVHLYPLCDGIRCLWPVAHSQLFYSFILVVFGSWFDHVKGWLSAGEQQHIMFISYEEMILVRSGPGQNATNCPWPVGVRSVGWFESKNLVIKGLCRTYIGWEGHKEIK